MKRSKRKVSKPVSHRTPAPIQAAEIASPVQAYCQPEYTPPAYTPEPVPVESARPWYQRLGF